MDVGLFGGKSSFEQHGVYDLIPRRDMVPGRKIYRPRPVFDIKVNPPTSQNPDWSLEKFKFRQTIAAFKRTMVQGVDFEEKRASNVRWEATLSLFALAVMHDLDIALIDIKTFFLYGKLDDLVYMEQPPEWVDQRYPAEDYVCRLNKSMYGLPQASHCAQQKLRANLTANKKFTQTTADDCVYVSTKPDITGPDYVATGTHVDDCLAIGAPDGIQTLVKCAGR